MMCRRILDTKLNICQTTLEATGLAMEYIKEKTNERQRDYTC